MVVTPHLLLDRSLNDGPGLTFEQPSPTSTRRNEHAKIQEVRRFVLDSVSCAVCGLFRPDTELPAEHALDGKLGRVERFLPAGWSDHLHLRQDRPVLFKPGCNRFDEKQNLLSAGKKVDAVVHRPFELSR